MTDHAAIALDAEPSDPAWPWKFVRRRSRGGIPREILRPGEREVSDAQERGGACEEWQEQTTPTGPIRWCFHAKREFIIQGS